MRQALSILLFLLISPFFLAKPIWAKVSLSIYPSLLEVMIQPGKTYTQAYEIVNDSEADLYLQAKIVPFEPIGPEGQIVLSNPKYQASNNYFSLANSGISLNQTFKLKAGNREQLVLKITIPQQASEKDQYFTFLIEQSSQGQFLNQTGGENLIKVGSNILLTISQSGNPFKQSYLAEFLARPKIADLFNKINFEILIQNPGNAFFKTNGRIDIYHRLTQKKVASLQLRPDNVLADYERKIYCLEGENTLPCQFSSFLPGPYRAILNFSPDGAGEEQTKTIGFWLLPFRLVLVILILFLIVWQINKFRYKRDS